MEKENLIRVIAQTNKKIEYLKEFRVFYLVIQTREVNYLSVLERLKEREDSNKTHQLKDI